MKNKMVSTLPSKTPRIVNIAFLKYAYIETSPDFSPYPQHSS